MKLYVTKDNINHRSKTVNKGDVIDEADRNHIGALCSVGCVPYNPDLHKTAPEPKPAPVAELDPEPKAVEKVTKKKSAPRSAKTKKASK